MKRNKISLKVRRKTPPGVLHLISGASDTIKKIPVVVCTEYGKNEPFPGQINPDKKWGYINLTYKPH